MPLRDHFHPPVSRQVSWQEIHGQWPARIVMQLKELLPPGFASGPTVHPGAQVEVDIATYERDDAPTGPSNGDAVGFGCLRSLSSLMTENRLRTSSDSSGETTRNSTD